MYTLPAAQGGPTKYKDEIEHSIYGRRFGVDDGNSLVGHSGERHPYELWTSGSTATSTSSTAQLCPTGASHMAASTASTFYMPAPEAKYLGVTKTLTFSATGGGDQAVVLIGGYFQTCLSATCTTITFSSTQKLYGGVKLECIQTPSTTYLWALVGSTGATGSGSTQIVFS